MEEATSGGALAIMANYGISAEGFEAPAWPTYGSRLFYQGAVALSDLLEMYQSLFGNEGARC